MTCLQSSEKGRNIFAMPRVRVAPDREARRAQYTEWRGSSFFIGDALSLAYLPFYTGDYLRDTAELSPREHGAYLLMLMWCWQRAKPMPNDMLRICRVARCRDAVDEEAARYVLEQFFVLQGDNCYHNARLERELERSNNLILRAKSGADARWNKTKPAELVDAKPMLNTMLNGCQSDASNTISITNPTTSINTIKSKTTTKAKTSAQAPFVLPEEIPKDQWDAWIESRTKARKAPTDWAKRLAVAKLSDLKEQGYHPAAVLAQSAFNGWVGLFPVKEQK